MEIIGFILPFIVAVFLLLFFRKQTMWWEYLVLIVPSLLLFLLTRTIMVSVNETDTEYLGAYITKVRHYDEWDEWVKRTCSKRVPSGRDSNGNTTYRTVYYDCSYRRYHPERWSYFDNNGEEHWLFYEEEFDAIRKRFNSPMVFVDMNRKYYRIDGDAQDYYWLGTKSTIRTVTYDRTYENKIQSSRSIFNFEYINEKEAHELGLYDYPKIEEYDQNPVLSDSISVSDKQIDAVKYINGYHGKNHQFRMYVLLFKDKDIEISEQQRSYWVGGNKNELVVCLGMKDSTTVSWCNAFSWCDAPTLEVKTESYFAEKDSLDLISYCDYIETLLIKDEWVRKEFVDFDYVRPEMSMTQYIWLIIIVFLYNIGISLFIILNDFRNRES